MPISSLIIINDFCATHGGADEVAIVEAAAMAAQGVSVHFAHMDAAGKNCPDSRLNHANIILHDFSALGGIHRSRKFLFDGISNKAGVRAVASLAGSLGEQCPVHVHGWTKGFSPAIFGLGARLGRKVVYTLHDFVPTCPNGAFYDFSKNTICRRKPLSAACASCNCDRESRLKKAWRLSRQLAIRRNLKTYRDFQVRITVSHFAQRIFENNAVSIDRVVPNPIDVERIPYRDPSARSEYYFIGRLVPEKGGDLLAAAARAAGIKCNFIGTGPMEADLKQSFPEHRFLGWQNRAFINEHLAKARAMIFPSRWYETQGLAPLEAAAQGVPTLCAQTCAAAEYAIDDVSGITFPAMDIPNLTAALGRAQDNSLISRISRTAYERFWSGGHDKTTHVTRLKELYQNI